MPKIILITGADGFIGKHLVERLKDDFLICVDHSSDFVVANSFNSANFNMDVDSPGFVQRMLDFLGNKKLDCIYHFGSPCSVIQFNENLKDSINSTINGFANVLELSKRKKCQLVYPSSGNVYGDIPTPQSENMVPRPNNVYALCKLYCEYMARDCGSVGLRIFAGYGPGEEMKGRLSSVVGLFLNQIIKGESPVIYGNGEQARDFVYIDDVVDVLVKCMKVKGKGNIVNVGSGESHTFNQLIEIMNKVAGSNIKPTYVEKPLSYVENTCADTNNMKRFFKNKPISIEEGIRKYIGYIFKNPS
jgi:UDP-glucose 4-epimerase